MEMSTILLMSRVRGKVFNICWLSNGTVDDSEKRSKTNSITWLFLILCVMALLVTFGDDRRNLSNREHLNKKFLTLKLNGGKRNRKFENVRRKTFFFFSTSKSFRWVDNFSQTHSRLVLIEFYIIVVDRISPHNKKQLNIYRKSLQPFFPSLLKVFRLFLFVRFIILAFDIQ